MSRHLKEVDRDPPMHELHFFFFKGSGPHRALPSSPPRPSSDLVMPPRLRASRSNTRNTRDIARGPAADVPPSALSRDSRSAMIRLLADSSAQQNPFHHPLT